MSNQEPDPVRSRPVHLPIRERSNQSIIVFLTVCVAHRRPLLARREIQHHLERTWKGSAAWLVGKYVLMPDHLHLVCTPAARDTLSLVSWVRFWKTQATKTWPFPEECPIWQSNFWDRQLRNNESYSKKWDYIAENPVRAGLCLRADEWPFRGEQNVFRFHAG